MSTLITKTPFYLLLSIAFCLFNTTVAWADPDPVDGGTLSIEGGALTIEICAGDDTSDAFNVDLTGVIGDSAAWLITDLTGEILAIPPGPPFDLDLAGPGTCLIWHISYNGAIEGLNVSANTADLMGCFDLSNEITVIRDGVDGGGITFPDGTFSTEICAGDGVPDPLDVVVLGNQVGAEFVWTITDSEGTVLALPGAPPFDLESAGPGTCLIIGVAYNTEPGGFVVGANLDELDGCYSLSNPLSVKRNAVNGGFLTTADGAIGLNICGNDGVSDAFNVILDDNTGEAGAWVVSDADGVILEIPDSPPFDPEGISSGGTVQVWFVAYRGPITGLMVGNNISDVSGCRDFSNPITINLDGVDGGAISLESNGGTTAEVCTGDGNQDLVYVNIDWNPGGFSKWIITDTNNEILDIPADSPFDFENAGAGTCLIYHIAHCTNFDGLAIGNNITDLSGDFDISNAITVNRTGIAGGTIATPTGQTALGICAGDGIPDPFDVILTGNIGANSSWVITDIEENILANPTGPPFDLDGAGAGTCLVYHLSYEDGLTGLTVGNNLSDLEGCYALSNNISVDREDPEGGALTFDGGGTEIEICAGDGISDAFTPVLVDAVGSNMGWIITDPDSNILDLPLAPPFDLETAGGGLCLIWHIGYGDGLSGLEVGENTMDLNGCFDLSNPLRVIREGLSGGNLTTMAGETELEICANDGVTDGFQILLNGNSGEEDAWVITDDSGNILALPLAPPFDLEGAGEGVCQVWYLAYSFGLSGLTVGNNVADLDGCFGFSNPITVTRYAPEGGDLSFSGGGTTLDICAGDGNSDAFTPELINNVNSEEAWIITDPSGVILGLPSAPPFDLEGAGGGACSIYHLSYGGDITGLAMGNNIADLAGCLDLSNAIVVNRTGVNGGVLATTDGATELDICAGDGISDAFNVVLNENEGDQSAWIITGPDGRILGLPPSPPFDLDAAGSGTCQIWNISYATGLTGLNLNANVADLNGCYAFSNPITVNREDPAGGELRLPDGTEVLDICAGDGIPDPFTPIIQNNNGSELAWIITDPNGTILALPAGPPFDLEGAGGGQCLLWALSYGGTITGLTTGANINDLEGCLDISNAITVNRTGVSGGVLTTADGLTEFSICAGDGIPDPFNVILNEDEGANNAWVITDPNGTILGLPLNPPFDLEGAGAGVCSVWNLSYADGLTGLAMGNNVADLSGCYSFSNAIIVDRIATVGGLLEIEGGGTAVTICAGDGIPDPINVELTGNEGPNFAWIISDDQGNILDLPISSQFDLEGAGGGTCLIWNISFDNTTTGIEVGENTMNISGCFELSNPITVTRNGVAGGSLTTTDGLTEFSICAGDGIPDPFDVVLTDNEGENNTWIITAPDGEILGLPSSPPFDLEGAGGGVCSLWSISFTNGLMGMTVGENVNDLVGCYALSNAIVVNRIADDNVGGELSFSDGSGELSICAGDGIPDPLEVELTANMGDNSAWVITDEDGNILDLPAGPPFDLEGAGAGICLIWNISYSDGLSGLAVGNNVDELEGCHHFSNFITVNRTGVAGGAITLDGGVVDTTMCVYSDVAENFDIHITGASGANQSWVITNSDGVIVRLPSSSPISFIGGPPGTCQIWNISYSDGLTGLDLDANAADLNGCFAFSNPITIMKQDENDDPLCTDVSTKDLTDHNAFSVTPNPTSEFVNININRILEEQVLIRLVDVSGKVLYTDYSRAQTIPMDLSDVESGVYFIELSNENVFAVQKVIKQ